MSFANRHEIEEYLASLVTQGAIVEIGCGFGNGLLALTRGNCNNLPIYGIDPYREYSDPLGGNYGPETKVEMLENTEGIEFSHIELSSLDALRDWEEGIGLLWVDLSMSYQDLKHNLLLWLDYVIDGGYIAITGLSYSTLGTAMIMDEMIASRQYTRELPEQNLVAVLKKKVNYKRQAAFYIVGAHSAYIGEAVVSAQSVQEKLNVDTFLFTSVNEDVSHPAFTEVFPLPERKYSGWYRNQVWFFNMAVGKLLDYDQLLYLDTDTFVCRDCSGVWQILDHYDMALGHAAGRGATPTAVNCPSEFATLGVGVNFFNNSQNMRDFFEVWLKQYEQFYHIYEETDEGPIRDLLFLNEYNIRYYVLAPEEHCRFGFGVWLNGAVSILHGRVSQPLAEIAAEINEVSTMRLYRWNGKTNGMLWHHVPQ